MNRMRAYAPMPDIAADRSASTDEDFEIDHSTTLRRLELTKTLIKIGSCLGIFLVGILMGVWLPDHVKSSAWNISDHSSVTRPMAEAWREIGGITVEGTQCGRSWEEAEKLGCHFDVMASRWYSPECFDQEILDAMLEEPQVNFTWYADRTHTEVYPAEKALRGEFVKIWPDNNYHIKHCLYLWRKLHHAIVKNRPIDEDILAYGHTVHCTRMILEWMEPGFERKTISVQRSGTPFCRRNPLGMLDA